MGGERNLHFLTYNVWKLLSQERHAEPAQLVGYDVKSSIRLSVLFRYGVRD